MGGGRVAALIEDIREYKQRKQERESMKALGYRNLNGMAASVFRSSKEEQTIWRQRLMKTTKARVDRCEDEPTPNISTTVVNQKNTQMPIPEYLVIICDTC